MGLCLWRAWARYAVLSHSNSVKFYRFHDLRLYEIACVSPKQFGLSNIGVELREYFVSMPKVIYVYEIVADLSQTVAKLSRSVAELCQSGADLFHHCKPG